MDNDDTSVRNRPEALVGAHTASQHALRNWQSNLRALAQSQPRLAEALATSPIGQSSSTADSPKGELEWIYGRDGALTAIEGEGDWWSGCSLPRRAAGAMLRKLTLRGTTGCFLAPPHGCQIEVALGMLAREQAILAVIPDWRDLLVMLHCCDFATDILTHRLWLAAGEDWAGELRDILRQNPGLPTPQQFIRTATLDEEDAAELIQPAQQTFVDESRRRVQVLEDLRNAPSLPSPGVPGAGSKRGTLLVLGASGFRLWDCAGSVLSELAGQMGDHCRVLDTRDPCSCSPLGLACVAAECGGVIAADLGRADLSAGLPGDVPLVTWITRPAIPAFGAAGPRDALLLADAKWLPAASQSGWPKDRITIAQWPQRAASLPDPAQPAHLAILADTRDTTPNPADFELSSHQLLWEMIREELRANPFALDEDLRAYLLSRMHRLEIAEEGFDWGRFVEGLVVPAYEQGLARMLLGAGLPVRLHGHGWRNLPEFAAHAPGPITSEAALVAAAGAAAALVHVWPIRTAHPIDAIPRPVLRRASADRVAFISSARKALAGGLAPTSPVGQTLDLNRIVQAIGRGA